MKVLTLAHIKGDWSDVVAWANKIGVEVVSVTTYKAAIRALSTDLDIDVILVDNCADDSGLRLLRTIKLDHRLCSLPVIMTGGEFSDGYVHQCLANDVDDIMLLPTTEQTLEAKLERASQRGKRRILLVDDQESILEILSQILAIERYLPICALSGEEALQVLQQQSVHAVVVDIVMPGMSGVELLERVKLDFPDIPVILITGQCGRCGPHDAIAMGADGYFAKPFNNTELMYTLRRVLGGGRPRSGSTPHKSLPTNRR